jgi:hypothetical protein
MERINAFSLEDHAGPYERWPLRSRLFFDGRDTGRSLGGYVVEAQFRVGGRYLLVTSDDCPFEETTRFYYLDGEFRVLSRKWFLTPYQSWCLQSMDPAGESSFRVVFYGDAPWLLRIRPRRLFGVGSYLSMRRLP